MAEAVHGGQRIRIQGRAWGPTRCSYRGCDPRRRKARRRAELWVWHSSRFARGDGRRGRRSLTTVSSLLRYSGVTPRSADPEDDEDLERDGNSRRRLLGATATAETCPDGFATARIASEAGRQHGRCVSGRLRAGRSRSDGDEGPRFVDDKRVPTIRPMFKHEGSRWEIRHVARKLNGEGHRRRSGALWTPGAVHRFWSTRTTPGGSQAKRRIVWSRPS